jgi:tetratricopeptide (TPR) repeat protein
MIAVLQHLLDAGSVEHEPGSWRLRCPATEIGLQVPETLRQMIRAQIERLSAAEQRVLEVAAIAGMTFIATIRAPTANLDPVLFDECCEALAGRNHILRLAGTQELPDGQVVQRYEFVHALYREVLYQRQAPARRVMLHRRGAERIVVLYADNLDDVATRIAYHFELGADWPRAVQYLRRVADVAGKQGAPLRAKVNLEHALTLAARLPHTERVEAEVGILDALLSILIALTDPAAVNIATLLRERAAQYGLAEVEARALVDLAVAAAWVSGERSLELTEQALRLCETQGDTLMRARTHMRCMVRRIMSGRWDMADADACRADLDDVRRLGTREDVARDTIDSSYVELFSTHYRKSYRDTVESLAVLKQAGGQHLHLNYTRARRLSEFIGTWSLILLGEWGAALRELDAAIALTERNADRNGGVMLQLLRCWTQVLAMDFAGAHAGCALVSPPDRPLQTFPRHFCLTLEGTAAAGLGDQERAFERLLTAGEEIGRQPQVMDWYWRLLQERALAGLWLSRGELERAREGAEQMVAHAGATAERTWQALAWDLKAKVAFASGDPLEARDHIERGLAAIDGVEAPVAAWQVHATAAEICQALGESDRAQSHRDSSRNIVLKLAASLERHEASRRTFLNSPAVASVLDSAAVPASARLSPTRVSEKPLQQGVT